MVGEPGIQGYRVATAVTLDRLVRGLGGDVRIGRVLDGESQRDRAGVAALIRSREGHRHAARFPACVADGRRIRTVTPRDIAAIVGGLGAAVVGQPVAQFRRIAGTVTLGSVRHAPGKDRRCVVDHRDGLGVGGGVARAVHHAPRPVDLIRAGAGVVVRWGLATIRDLRSGGIVVATVVGGRDRGHFGQSILTIDRHTGRCIVECRIHGVFPVDDLHRLKDLSTGIVVCRIHEGHRGLPISASVVDLIGAAQVQQQVTQTTLNGRPVEEAGVIQPSACAVVAVPCVGHLSHLESPSGIVIQLKGRAV